MVLTCMHELPKRKKKLLVDRCCLKYKAEVHSYKSLKSFLVITLENHRIRFYHFPLKYSLLKHSCVPFLRAFSSY